MVNSLAAVDVFVGKCISCLKKSLLVRRLLFRGTSKIVVAAAAPIPVVVNDADLARTPLVRNK